MERDYNERMKTKESQIRIGCKVLVKLDKVSKDTTIWDPRPYEVIEVKGNMITAARADHVMTRNSSRFKLYSPEEQFQA